MVLSCYFEGNREDTINFSRVSITSFAQIIRIFLNVSFDIMWHYELRYTVHSGKFMAGNFSGQSTCLPYILVLR